jgi:hypothetical protein
MRFRNLLVAWSALCFVACYLLSAFWAMSYLPGGRIQIGAKAWGLYRPYGCAIIVVAALGIMPWTGWRFNLRTLLIATTLLAVALGLAVYAAKK